MLSGKNMSDFFQAIKMDFVLNFSTEHDVNSTIKKDDAAWLVQLLGYYDHYLHSINGLGGNTLFYAVKHKAYACTLLLLQKGADPNAEDWNKSHCFGTSLHKAVDNKNLALTRLLLVFGADMHIKKRYDKGCFFGPTPYEWAQREGPKELVELLDTVLQSEQTRASLIKKEASIKASVDLAKSEGKAATREQLESLLDIQEKLAGIWDSYASEEEIPCLQEYYQKQKECYEARASCYSAQLNPKPITEQEVNSDLKQNIVFFKTTTQPKQRTINKEVYQAIPDEENDSFSHLGSNKLPF